MMLMQFFESLHESPQRYRQDGVSCSGQFKKAALLFAAGGPAESPVVPLIQRLMATVEGNLSGDTQLTVVIVNAYHSAHAAGLFEFVHPDFDLRLPWDQHSNNTVRFLPVRNPFVNESVNKNALDVGPTVTVDFKPLAV
jgi:hypothetical protein